MRVPWSRGSPSPGRSGDGCGERELLLLACPFARLIKGSKKKEQRKMCSPFPLDLFFSRSSLEARELLCDPLGSVSAAASRRRQESGGKKSEATKKDDIGRPAAAAAAALAAAALVDGSSSSSSSPQSFLPLSSLLSPGPFLSRSTERRRTTALLVVSPAESFFRDALVVALSFFLLLRRRRHCRRRLRSRRLSRSLLFFSFFSLPAHSVPFFSLLSPFPLFLSLTLNINPPPPSKGG